MQRFKNFLIFNKNLETSLKNPSLQSLIANNINFNLKNLFPQMIYRLILSFKYTPLQ